jgi:hypothetical protein
MSAAKPTYKHPDSQFEGHPVRTNALLELLSDQLELEFLREVLLQATNAKDPDVIGKHQAADRLRMRILDAREKLMGTP